MPAAVGLLLCQIVTAPSPPPPAVPAGCTIQVCVVCNDDYGLDLVRSDLFRHAYAVSIAQALLLQDGLKILLITLISPAALPSLFPPDTKRAKRLRRAMRAVYTFLESVL